MRKSDEVNLTTVYKLSLELVHEKRRLDGKTKPLLSPPSNVQLLSNL